LGLEPGADCDCESDVRTRALQVRFKPREANSDGEELIEGRGTLAWALRGERRRMQRSRGRMGNGIDLLSAARARVRSNQLRSRGDLHIHERTRPFRMTVASNAADDCPELAVTCASMIPVSRKYIPNQGCQIRRFIW
jgi:hypothetical protein